MLGTYYICQAPFGYKDNRSSNTEVQPSQTDILVGGGGVVKRDIYSKEINI